MAAGTHTIVLAIDRTVQTDSLAIRIDGDALEAAPAPATGGR